MSWKERAWWSWKAPLLVLVTLVEVVVVTLVTLVVIGRRGPGWRRGRHCSRWSARGWLELRGLSGWGLG
jgi:hypothetical protein